MQNAPVGPILLQNYPDFPQPCASQRGPQGFTDSLGPSEHFVPATVGWPDLPDLHKKKKPHPRTPTEL